MASADGCPESTKMKTLSNQANRDLLLSRLRQVTPNSQRRWGRMTPHQMVCHLSDSFKSVIGERQVNGDKSNLMTKTVVRWIALYAPMKWPHGVPTMAENDQEKGGTPPEDFQRDVDELAAIIRRITARNAISSGAVTLCLPKCLNATGCAGAICTAIIICASSEFSLWLKRER